jgi:hypothetical protein
MCAMDDDAPKPPPTPGWRLAGFETEEAANRYKAQLRAQYGRTLQFPSGPLHLTDVQLAAVRRAAALLQPQARSQFLQSIAHELADADPIDDEAVQRVVDAIMDAAARL